MLLSFNFNGYKCQFSKGHLYHDIDFTNKEDMNSMPRMWNGGPSWVLYWKKRALLD